MKVFVAGASGAIGGPAIDSLIQYGQEVFGTTRSQENAQAIAAKGAKPVILDIFDQEAVLKALKSIQPDVIVDLLTSLPKEYTPESMQKAAKIDLKLRLEGGGFLQSAAENFGVKRYIVQSSAFWYSPGEGLAEESEPFAFNASPGISSGCKMYAEIERRLLQSYKIEGVCLRFGFFYGPRTWFHPEGNVADQIRKKEFPIIGKGEGIWNFIHVTDAAKAVAAAVYSAQGAYNIVNNKPSKMAEWLPGFARHIKAPEPPRISEEEGLKIRGEDAVYYATKLRGASNAKAKRELDFEPRIFEWIT